MGAVLAVIIVSAWGWRHSRDLALAAKARAALPLYAHGGNAVRIGAAVELFHEACERGIADGCAGVGSVTLRGIVVDADPVAGLRLLERACVGGSAGACAQLGTLYETGSDGVDRDPQRAQAAYTRAAGRYEEACAAGETLACAGYGTMLVRGVGVAKDSGRAFTLFRSACASCQPERHLRWLAERRPQSGRRPGLPQEP